MTYEHGEPGAMLTLMEEEDERRIVKCKFCGYYRSMFAGPGQGRNFKAVTYNGKNCLMCEKCQEERRVRETKK